VTFCLQTKDGIQHIISYKISVFHLWKKAQKGVGHLVNDFMSSVATNILQLQQVIYAQPTYIWTEILYSSAFRKLIVVVFKLRPN